MTAAVSYGPGVPDDSTLRLCGDVSGGKRVVELGISDAFNSIVLAIAGAKAIAVDPSVDRITALRKRAAAAEVHVECHQSDLADLGFLTSASIQVAVANHTIGDLVDPGRLFRQVHRVLQPSAALIVALDHPFAEVHNGSIHYGARGLTIGDWFTQLGRANFRVDSLHELGVDEGTPVPTTMVLRARKEGY